jgi:hypothetical protein
VVVLESVSGESYVRNEERHTMELNMYSLILSAFSRSALRQAWHLPKLTVEMTVKPLKGAEKGRTSEHNKKRRNDNETC